jgi:pimeloyl-ACP methyl ester carboxylesterase
MDHLAAQGYYCVAPDMRGYSKGACPKGIKNYSIELLRKDVLKLADNLGISKFHLIAHDWGAVIGWNLVYNFSDRIASWTSLSVPHTKAFARAYRNDPVQKKKSRYIGYFLLPFFPEIMIKRNDFKSFRRLWKNSSAEEVAYYLNIYRRKDSLTGTLNYYRANFRKGRGQPIGDIVTPTLFIWGKNDLAIGETAAKGGVTFMKGNYTFLELEGGHWLIQTNYEEVKAAIIEHLPNYRIN